MGEPCGMYEGREKYIEGFGCETWGEKEHSEDLDVDGENNIKMDLQEVRWKGMDWIDLNQVRVRWRALVIAVITWRDP
jgi:hypothetical protein